MKALEEIQKQNERHSSVASDERRECESLVAEAVSSLRPLKKAAAAGVSQHSVSEQGGSEIRKGDDETDRRRLWVERYSPRSYLELLSEEFINRALLRWIKASIFTFTLTK